MSMLDIFKETLQEEMAIASYKELSAKYKITLSYKGMVGICELGKTCAPRQEESYCRKAINTAVSSMYIVAGNLKEAQEWLNGNKWNCIITNKIPNKDTLKDIIRNRLETKKEKLSCLQSSFEIDLKNINLSTYEDNAISALLEMKKLKSEIAELELCLQFQ